MAADRRQAHVGRLWAVAPPINLEAVISTRHFKTAGKQGSRLLKPMPTLAGARITRKWRWIWLRATSLPSHGNMTENHA